MQIYHNSQDENYREPLGAVPAGSKVTLKVKISGTARLPKKVLLRCWHEEYETVHEMARDEAHPETIYKITLDMPEKPSLFWYYFIVETEEQTFYYSNNSKMGAEGSQTDYPTGNSFQITIFSKDFKTPEWFYDSIMYQIFPDRFAGNISSETPKRYEEYKFHEDWYEPLSDIPHPFEAGPALCDFYGGNFKGIEEKIPYLKSLGISVIYLNPIFEAYSNHRYDTGNYKNIDPVLGTEEDFRNLCRACHENGIRIILDGVFSHTGSDSVYFDKYRRYNNPEGAYHNQNSPYRQWYQWESDANEYKSWWGCSNLPNVCEMNSSYLDYILRDEDSVIKKWLKAGADGWRLDVADELPDEFIRILRKEAKSEKEDALIIGEVWEDASNKVSYSENRKYLFGEELDSVMNYPFKDLFIGFLCKTASSSQLASGVMSIMENYPKCVLYSLMNIVSTHDTMRIKTVLGEPYIKDNLSFSEKQNFRLGWREESLSIKRVKLIAFLQMTFVGVPCIYYGDEIGMQGLSDPFNRMPFSWRSIDPELLLYYRTMTNIRNTHPALRTGKFKIIFANDGIFAYERAIEKSKDVFSRKRKNENIICIINRDDFEKSFTLSGIKEGNYISLLSNKEYSSDGNMNYVIPPLSADILLKKE